MAQLSIGGRKTPVQGALKLGYAALSESDYAEFLETLSAMESNFAKVKVCDYKNSKKCDLALEPEIEEVITTSRDPEELKHYWVQFYDKAGTAVRPQFERYVELNTKAAKLNSKSNQSIYIPILSIIYIFIHYVFCIHIFLSLLRVQLIIIIPLAIYKSAQIIIR